MKIADIQKESHVISLEFTDQFMHEYIWNIDF